MLKDPDYLLQLGELATLKNAIQCYFHQDAFEIYDGYEALFADMWRNHPDESGDLLREQLQAVLAYGDVELERFWRQNSDWLCASTADTRVLLCKLLDACNDSTVTRHPT